MESCPDGGGRALRRGSLASALGLDCTGEPRSFCPISYLDHGAGRSLNEMWRWVNYVTFGATTLIGPLARVQKLGFWRYPALALGASTLFFLTSNFSVWAEGREYPMTMAGLVECYYLGTPLLRPNDPGRSRGHGCAIRAWPGS